MLVLHMNNQIIISLDPLLTNMLTSRNRTIETLGKVYYLIVSVERLFRFERS